MTLNYIWYRSFTSKAQRNMAYPFFAITLRSTLRQWSLQYTDCISKSWSVSSNSWQNVDRDVFLINGHDEPSSNPTVYISLHTNALQKGMNPLIPSCNGYNRVVDWLFSLDKATGLRESKALDFETEGYGARNSTHKNLPPQKKTQKTNGWKTGDWLLHLHHNTFPDFEEENECLYLLSKWNAKFEHFKESVT